MYALMPCQHSKLLANRNVLDVSEKSVSFTPAFKIKAIHQVIKGVPQEHIFLDAEILVDRKN